MTMQLRPARLDDLDVVLAFETDPDAAPWITGWQRNRHEQALADPDETLLLFDDDGETVGFVLLAGIASVSKDVELRRIVVERKGQGIGRRALRLVLDLAFEQLGAHRVWLDVKSRNERARRTYTAAGFVEEGIARDACGSDGCPLIVMSVRAREGPAAELASDERRGSAS